ncbi:F0F1 ATP synthase subunit gamma [Candidatus Macondimonas diazotrophica]|jgi:F-type H+-transporting ATPase subunit gamma|uniref:ATP synthase gamma chain n=1 Tax=Candidatus Macondimonas diazotrophica TaxID=2305248 RepID=A0A4Z0F7N1_9GAMM|nr:F0F1 ATP synthase subunit gamma [Candidatus Macondimonas diazotrophica]NCU01340.1 F0F1 ATP synthase subunit gamma [Candidatus Macondimonas diazotrophica]TFZ82020.1 F0F1 ATP synthase subunit gamma [Candidatus Macondimonas diazotrophica]HBG51833.1 F0F1 ATP synthase subunit gamma [Gammaproteobacteria bacterium]
MAGTKEIRNQIRSVRNTQKITKAMEMVAASKMRKAQDQMTATRPYAERMREVIGHLAAANPDYRHPFLEPREPLKRVGIIFVSTDRGLCGGLNINLFKTVLTELRRFDTQDIAVDLAILGGKGVGFFRRLGGQIVAQQTGLGDRPHLQQVIGTIKVMLDAYRDGKIDRLLLVRNQFVNTMTQKPVVQQVLPVEPVRETEMLQNWDYLYEPSPEALLDDVLVRYVESQIYQAVVENVACEMAARMVAMKSASDNAGEVIQRLTLVYNKARQAAITQELAEIVAGAAAVS